MLKSVQMYMAYVQLKVIRLKLRTLPLKKNGGGGDFLYGAPIIEQKLGALDL